MVVKKTKKRVFAWKPIVAVSGAVIGVFVVIFFVLYFANKPNYRDLEKEFERISANIPADWQLLSEANNKGTWGLFCLQIEGSECPYISSQLSSSNIIDATNDLQIIENIVNRSSYLIVSQNVTHCSANDDKYYCMVESEKDGYKLQASIGLSGDSKVLRIHLGK